MRYSAQREAIIEVVRAAKDHPTADIIYERVRVRFPHISLGTVYRNLSEMAQTGLADTMETEDGFIHYDGNTETHRHFICNRCNRIIDLFLPCPLPEAFSEMGLTVESAKYFYYGKCNSCNQEINKKKEN